MKKSLILTLLLTLCIAGGAAYAAADIWSQHDAVTFRQNILTGDPSDAEGLAVRMLIYERYNQFWDVTHTMGADMQTDAAYEYTILSDSDRVMGLSKKESNWISLHTKSKSAALYKNELNPDELPEEYRDLAENYTEGGHNAKTVKMQELMKYYPIFADLELPDIHASWNDNHYLSSVNNRSDNGAMARALEKEFQDYFRIPVPEDAAAVYSIQHTGSHYKLNLEYTRSDIPNFICTSAVTEDACYFAFHSDNFDTEKLDTSQIKGGFGIYKLPYNSEDGILPELSTIHKLDPAAEIQHLEISPSGDVLQLHTRENGLYMITFIDLATGEALQKLSAGDENTIKNHWDVITGEDWILLQNGRFEYILISRRADGTYAETLHLDLPLSEVPWNEEKADAITATSDGSRIALASNTYSYFYDGGDFFTAIYGADGLNYYAKYESSLSIKESRGNFIGTANLTLEWN